jgi:transketolase
MIDSYWQGLIEAAQTNKNMVVLDADCAISNKTSRFGDTFPDRFFNVGIAEQSLVGIAAGMAALGLIPFVNAFASFLTRRAYDQILMSAALPHLNIKLVGHHTGVRSLARDGASHQSIEDIALMRALGDSMTILCPADRYQAAEVVKQALMVDGPVYVRMHRSLSKKNCFSSPSIFPGSLPVYRTGEHISILVTGEMLDLAEKVANHLLLEEISAEILVATSLVPFNTNVLCNSAMKTGRVVTLEEHRTTGGLGSIVAEELSSFHPTPLMRFGISSGFGCSSLDDNELMSGFGLTPEQISTSILESFFLKSIRGKNV